jgi:hypothetical protein
MGAKKKKDSPKAKQSGFRTKFVTQAKDSLLILKSIRNAKLGSARGFASQSLVSFRDKLLSNPNVLSRLNTLGLASYKELEELRRRVLELEASGGSDRIVPLRATSATETESQASASKS